MKSRTEIAILQTALTAVLWGTSFPVVTFGLRDGLDPLAFVFLRFALAAGLMLTFAAVVGKSVTPLLKSKEVWIVGAFNAVGFLCQFIGQQYTAASLAALLLNLSLALAAAGGALFLGERFGMPKGVGIVLAAAGTVLVTTNGNLTSVVGGQLWGDLLYLVGAVSWAGYIVYAKKKTDQLNWDPVSLAAALVTVTAILVTPVALAVGKMTLGGAPLWVIGYSAFFNTAIPFVLYQQGLKFLTASTSALVLTLEIVVALVVSAVVLGEGLSLLAWTGAGMILLSILLASGMEMKNARATP